MAAYPVHISLPLGGRNSVSSANIWTYKWILAVVILSAKTKPRLKEKIEMERDFHVRKERKRGGG
jgi:hypothetical protein